MVLRRVAEDLQDWKITIDLREDPLTGGEPTLEDPCGRQTGEGRAT